MDMKTCLCVGGPLAGKRYAILHGTGFRVAVRLDVPENNRHSPDFKPNSQAVAFHQYREEIVHTPEGDVSFWTPVGQTPLDTLKILLGAYEKSFAPGSPS